MGVNLKTEQHVVAFIDVLGAKAMIENDSNGSLEIIHAGYEVATKITDMTSYVTGVKLLVSVFSDNIVFATKVNDENTIPLALQLVSLSTVNFQHIMLQQGILTRGGITIGGFFRDETMVWGKALTRAYELENRLAIYPRVVFDPEFVEVLSIQNEEGFKLSSRYILDQDGLYFADYFKFQNDIQHGSLSDIINNLIADKEKFKGKDSIIQKYDWLIYHTKRKIESYERQ